MRMSLPDLIREGLYFLATKYYSANVDSSPAIPYIFLKKNYTGFYIRKSYRTFAADLKMPFSK